MPSTSIEQEVLRYDRRGIGRLHARVGENFCTDAAEFILANDGPVLIGTGFYIAHAQKPETDGPPGALALARGLEKLGRRVEFVTDAVCAPMMERVAEGRRVHVIPLGEGDNVKQTAKTILDKVKPGLLIAIERCGPDAEGRFLQFSGTDITKFTGRMEYLFQHNIPSIGIVDGGNEIGIGNFADDVRQLPACLTGHASFRPTGWCSARSPIGVLMGSSQHSRGEPEHAFCPRPRRKPVSGRSWSPRAQSMEIAAKPSEPSMAIRAS